MSAVEVKVIFTPDPTGEMDGRVEAFVYIAGKTATTVEVVEVPASPEFQRGSNRQQARIDALEKLVKQLVELTPAYESRVKEMVQDWCKATDFARRERRDTERRLAALDQESARALARLQQAFPDWADIVDFDRINEAPE